MAIKDKFTWADFLKANPDAKEPKLKRTSPEGKKAFEKAYKEFAKIHLKTREEKLTAETDRAGKNRTKLIGQLKNLKGKRKHVQEKRLNKKTGRVDAYLAKLAKAKEGLKETTKKI